MEIMITRDQLKKFAPNYSKSDATYDILTKAINSTMEKYDISTLRRQRYFITQAFFETQGFTKFVESLYYSTAQRLVEVWDKRFTLDKNDKTKAYALSYIKNPQKLASFIYANRFGNGDEASGDGFKFRGRGGFHLTFRDNYAQYSNDTYGDLRLLNKPDLVAELPTSIDSAGWFWRREKLNLLADKDEFTKVTKEVNGSAVTAPKRLVVLGIANKIFI